MRRHWIAFAALVLVPLALMAVSPPVETPSTETSEPTVETPAETTPPADLEALEDALFLPGAEEVSNHCCSPAAEQACVDACRPDLGFAACAGNTCFCVCVTIN